MRWDFKSFSIFIMILGIYALLVFGTLNIKRAVNIRGPWFGQFFSGTKFYGSPLRIFNARDLNFRYLYKRPFKKGQKQHYSFIWTTCLIIKQPQKISFRLASDDGSWLYINGQKVIDNGDFHPVEMRKGTSNLEKGDHLLEVRFFQAGGQAFLVLDADFGKGNFRPIPKRLLRPPHRDFEKQDKIQLKC